MTDHLRNSDADSPSEATTRSVVVGIDRRGRSTSAVVWAVEDAERSRSTLTLVSARAPYDAASGTEGGHDMSTFARRLALRDVQQREVVGDPVSALLDQSLEADLLVVGARTMNPSQRIVLGSTSRALARWSPVPVVVVPERWMQPNMASSPVVAGVRPPAPARQDGQPGPGDGPEVLDFACARAAELKVPLVVVSSWEVPPLSACPTGDAGRLRAAHEHALEQRLSPWRKRHPGLEIVTRPTTRASGDALLELSRMAQLVVVGRHHARALSGHLGHTCSQVLSESTRPVVVVPSGSRDALQRDLDTYRAHVSAACPAVAAQWFSSARIDVP